MSTHLVTFIWGDKNAAPRGQQVCTGLTGVSIGYRVVSGAGTLRVTKQANMKASLCTVPLLAYWLTSVGGRGWG
eukprot:jgi/Chrzof1/867/Cz01g32020.t1